MNINLGDQFDFEIQFHDKPNGTPAINSGKDLELEISGGDSVLTIQFNLPDSLNFRINSGCGGEK